MLYLEDYKGQALSFITNFVTTQILTLVSPTKNAEKN